MSGGGFGVCGGPRPDRTQPRSRAHTRDLPTLTPVTPASHQSHLPPATLALLRAEEVAELLRTSRAAVYTMAERGQLPGVYRLGRRLLFSRDQLLTWLETRRVPFRDPAEPGPTHVVACQADRRAPHLEGVR